VRCRFGYLIGVIPAKLPLWDCCREWQEHPNGLLFFSQFFHCLLIIRMNYSNFEIAPVKCHSRACGNHPNALCFFFLAIACRGEVFNEEGLLLFI